MKTLNIPELLVDFYVYEFDNQSKSFKIGEINKINITFKPTGKWYRFFICVEGVFTGRYLNLISAQQLDNYSVRYEIGVAYHNYTNGLTYNLTNMVKTTNTPQSVIESMNDFIENHISKINKFSSRDELTILKLI